MQYNTATLNNGLRIIHLPNTSKIAYCGYQIKAGTRNEKPGDEGLAHFCEHVTFKGTQTHTSTAIINKLESVGGDLNAFTNKEDTVFYSAIPVEHFAKAVDVLSDIVFYSIFPQAEIDKEVEVICDEIESYNDSPAELIYDEFENLVFKGHPLGHNILGSADRVRGFATADAMRFTQQYYRPDNAIFFVYGNIDFKRLVKTLEKLTPKQQQESLVDEALMGANGKLPELTILNHDTHQAHVMIGNRAYSATHPLRIPLYLLNNMLGGPGMNARLNVILRERRGLVYSVESSMVCYGDTGLWSVYFGCDPHDVNRCVRLVKGEFKRLMEKPLPEKTLAAAKRQIKGQLAVA
jgi:predicted Zn-dependent peptidase